jgi:short-subunit dehydrogenase involved in D-alanine esterification of teichoic acids
LTTSLHENITCQIRLICLYMPLILKGKEKKVIYMTSGHADADVTRNVDLATFGIYAISKAGMNMAIAKLSAQYKQDGVLFISLSPGVADVGHYDREREYKANYTTKLLKLTVKISHTETATVPGGAWHEVCTVCSSLSRPCEASGYHKRLPLGYP